MAQLNNNDSLSTTDIDINCEPDGFTEALLASDWSRCFDLLYTGVACAIPACQVPPIHALCSKLLLDNVSVNNSLCHVLTTALLLGPQGQAADLRFPYEGDRYSTLHLLAACDSDRLAHPDNRFLVEFILSNCFEGSVDLRSDLGYSALDFALKNQNSYMIQYLVKKGADLQGDSLTKLLGLPELLKKLPEVAEKVASASSSLSSSSSSSLASSSGSSSSGGVTSYRALRTYNHVIELKKSEKALQGYMDQLFRIYIDGMSGYFEDTVYDQIRTILTDYVNINDKFVRKLKEYFAQPESPDPPIKLGTVMSDLAPEVIRSAEYHCSYKTLLQKIERNKLENRAFAKFLARCYSVEEKNINHYLIMPVQRTGRYNILLREILRGIPPSHPEYAALEAAESLYSHCGKKVNHRVYKIDKSIELEVLHNQIHNNHMFNLMSRQSRVPLMQEDVLFFFPSAGSVLTKVTLLESNTNSLNKNVFPEHSKESKFLVPRRMLLFDDLMVIAIRGEMLNVELVVPLGPAVSAFTVPSTGGEKWRAVFTFPVGFQSLYRAGLLEFSSERSRDSFLRQIRAQSCSRKNSLSSSHDEIPGNGWTSCSLLTRAERKFGKKYYRVKGRVLFVYKNSKIGKWEDEVQLTDCTVSQKDGTILIQRFDASTLSLKSDDPKVIAQWLAILQN